MQPDHQIVILSGQDEGRTQFLNEEMTVRPKSGV